MLSARIAKKYGAKILLRIDDLDHNRVQKKYIQDVFDTLNFLEIPWNEGPTSLEDFESNYTQINRINLYDSALATLLEQGALFACECSRNEILEANSEGTYPGTCIHKNISFEKENVCWRLLSQVIPLKINVYQNHQKEIELPTDMQYFVVRKKDCLASYQLASLVDDLFFDVDLVVRGSDLLASTYAQLHLGNVLGNNDFQNITFYHHPLLISGTEKLSKSSGSTSIQYLRKEGKKPTEIAQMIAKSLNLSEDFNNWEDLADHLIENPK